MIYVFKTSVKTEDDVKTLKAKLDNISSIRTWDFDLEDCDNILRIDGSNISAEVIIDLLGGGNFECRELE